MKNNLYDYALRIGGPLLADQRRLLLKVFDTVFRGEPYVAETPQDGELLQGIIALLDEIADQAHDRHGLDSLMEPEPNETEEPENPGPHNQYRCECELPGQFCSGVPGILAHLENGLLPEGATVERCGLCCRYASDAAALEKLQELGYAPPVIVDHCDAEKQGAEDDGRSHTIEVLLSKAEAAGLEPEDLDEAVHERAASIAANVNNSGMDGQLAYLIDEMGGEAVGKELDRLAAEKAPNKTAAGDEAVHAECHSDDRIYSAAFNAVRWFEQADDSEVLALAEDDWGDSYAADRVGMFMADIVPDVQKMFDYLEHYNQAQTKHIGWVCTVNKDHALKWLKAHRPLLHQRMLDIDA